MMSEYQVAGGKNSIRRENHIFNKTPNPEIDALKIKSVSLLAAFGKSLFKCCLLPPLDLFILCKWPCYFVQFSFLTIEKDCFSFYPCCARD